MYSRRLENFKDIESNRALFHKVRGVASREEAEATPPPSRKSSRRPSARSVQSSPLKQSSDFITAGLADCLSDLVTV